MFRFSVVLSIFFLEICLCFILTSAKNANHIVSTPLGSVAGSTLVSSDGRDIFSFRGIRYAKPPVGNLRFQPPQMIEYSNETIDATREGPACPQNNWGIESMSEDCLTLNVFTGSLTEHPERRSPVLVYIHPGGFYGLSSQTIFSGPQRLLDYDVVLVTINYRLASLGFLSTGDSWAPGNNGLKDQVVALRWVKQNIASFGGDPNKVTIIGYSAGSMSVLLHMLSPMSKGLFHRAIAMSATPTGQWKVPPDQLNLARKQAKFVDCPSDTSKQILECLLTKNATAISNTYTQFFEFVYDPILIWTPVIEPDCGQERFLLDDPANLIKHGKVANVPLIIGMTEYEFVGPAYTVIRNETLMNKMNQEWEDIAPISFLYERGTDKSKEISRNLKEYYLQSKDLKNDERSIKGLRELYADGVIGFGVHRYITLIAEYTYIPVYYYRFSYKGRYSHFYLSDKNDTLGAVHHDELIYLFNLDRIFPKIEKTDPEYETILRLTKMWTDFAKCGNPTPVAAQDNLMWPRYTNSKPQYFDIGSNVTIQNCLYCERFMIWDKLFPLL